MKKDVIFPSVSPDFENTLRIFCGELIQVIKDLRFETANAMPPQIKYVNEDYTIKATDTYTEYHVDNSSAEIDVTFCPLDPVKFKIVALDDSYDVNCIPAGSNTVNGYATDPVINQKFGWWEFSGGDSYWIGTTNGYSTIYEVSSETADTGLALDGTWDDVSGMSLLNGIYGKGFLDVYGYQYIADESYPSYMWGLFGVGKTSGNNAPDIKNNGNNGIRLTDQYIRRLHLQNHIHNFPYESDGSTIYMKAAVYSAELNVDNHIMYGDTDCPMYIRWRRIA